MTHLLKRVSNLRIAVLALCALLLICLIILLFNKPLNSDSLILNDVKNLDSLYAKGKGYMRAGNNDSALIVLTTVAQYAENGGTTADTILAVKAYNNAGIINFFNKNYAGAYSFYKKAIQAGGDTHAYWIHDNIAIILSLFHDYGKAENLMLETYQLARRANDWTHLNNAYYNILNLGLLSNRLDSINDIIMDYHGLPIPPDSNTVFLKEVSKGIQLYRNQKYADAISKFLIADSLSSKSRLSQRAKINCNIYIAKAFLSNNQPDSALSYLQKAVTLAKSQEMTDYVVELYDQIIECYQYMNRPHEANEYRKKYYSIRDSLSLINDMTVAKNLEKNYEIEKYEEKVALVVSEKKKFSEWLLLTCLFLVTTIAFLTITFIQKRKLQTYNRELFNKNIELLKAFEEERNNYISASANESKDKTVLSAATSNSEVISTLKIIDNEAQDKDDDSIDQKDFSNINIPLAEQQRIKEAIKNFFYCSTEYLSSDFSQRRLCEIVESNRLYVSYVINKVMGTTFYALLNEYRINEVKIRLLDDAKYGNMTIEAIANSVGYKSRSNFTLNFKKYTGLTTSEFLAMAKTVSKNK